MKGSAGKFGIRLSFIRLNAGDNDKRSPTNMSITINFQLFTYVFMPIRDSEKRKT